MVIPWFIMYITRKMYTVTPQRARYKNVQMMRPFINPQENTKKKNTKTDYGWSM